MNSKFLVFTGCLLFTFGCSHTNMEVASSDMPEDDVIAGESVAPRHFEKIALVVPAQDNAQGYTDKEKKNVKRGIASDDGPSETAKGGGDDGSAQQNERTTPPDGITQEEYDASKPDPNEPSSIAKLLRNDKLIPTDDPVCSSNTVTNVRKILAEEGVSTPKHIGRVGQSMQIWLKSGYAQIKDDEPTFDNDVCILDGGRAGKGTIFVKRDDHFTDGCSTHTGIPSLAGYHFKGCLRAKDKPRRYCGNTLAYVKAVLAGNGIKLPEHTGNAGKSGPQWLAAGFTELERSAPPQRNDICVFEGGSRGVGTIVVRQHNWKDGCRATTDLPHWSGYKMTACYRPPAK